MASPAKSGKRSAQAHPQEIPIPAEKRQRCHADLHGNSDRLHNTSTIPCGCSLATAKVNRWKSAAEMLNNAPDLSNALEKALTDLFLRRVSDHCGCTHISGHELTPLELVDVIRRLPEQLLFTYQGRVLRSRTGKPLPNPVIFPLHNPIHGRAQSGDILDEAELILEQQKSEMVTGQVVTHSAQPQNSSTSNVTNSVMGSIKPTSPAESSKISESAHTCRVLVLDLTGSENPGDCGTLPKQLSTDEHIRCDLLWCSLYTGTITNQLAACPSQLRVTQLFRAHPITRALRSAQWLRIPLVPVRRTVSSPGSTVGSFENKQSTSPTMLCANLCAALFHLLLPIAYEYGPELVCVLIGPEWTDSGNEQTEQALVQLLHLASGLGSAILVSLVSNRPPSTTVLNGLSGLAPESVSDGQTKSMVPTTK
ncbi:unnamed protein product [Echinostoma caproni]|uniref:Uncharacterized protein n=1 Tax=Echinostoma caproni TaxID=27848 RepID=A0A183AJ37_9TREM|nr:unnamed protein product [Echinostoma caproni]